MSGKIIRNSTFAESPLNNTYAALAKRESIQRDSDRMGSAAGVSLVC